MHVHAHVHVHVHVHVMFMFTSGFVAPSSMDSEYRFHPPHPHPHTCHRKRRLTCQHTCQAVKHQFDGHLWVVSEHQMPEAERRTKQAGKFALFFDAPPGDLDLSTVQYAAKMGGRCKVLDVRGLVLSIGHSKVNDDEVCAQLRDAVLECMQAGTQLVLRLGRTAPDFMGSWNRKDLPLDFLLPENAAAGPLQPVLHKMVQPPAKPSNFTVVEGYRLVVTSCFDMDSYHGYLRSKLPLQHMQPIQVMKNLSEVAEVLEYGLPAKSTDDDDAFAEMDRLAEML